MHFRTLREALRLLGASRDMILSWTPAAMGGLRDLFYDAVFVLVAFVLSMLLGSWVFSSLGWKTAAIYWVLVHGYLFVAANAYLLAMRRTLHAAGLAIGVDLLANLSTFVRTGRIHYDDKEARVKLHVHFRGGETEKDWMLHFATVQFLIHVLWIIVNCGINVVWYLLVVPLWAIPMWVVLSGLFAGLHWVISHRKLDFDWFTWFGTYNGVAGFLGVAAYAIFTVHVGHPHPEYALFAASVIGFVWATDDYKKYTGRTVIGAMAFMIVTYFLPSFTTSGVSVDLSDETAIFRFAVLVIMALVVVAIGKEILGGLFSSKPAGEHGH